MKVVESRWTCVCFCVLFTGNVAQAGKCIRLLRPVETWTLLKLSAWTSEDSDKFDLSSLFCLIVLCVKSIVFVENVGLLRFSKQQGKG